MASSGGRIGPSGIATHDVFVGNLPKDTDEAHLKKLFSKFGEIASISVMKKDENNIYGFVRYLSATDAEAATKENDGMPIEGNILSVRFGDKHFRKQGQKKKGPGQEHGSFGNKPDLVSTHGSGDGNMKHQRQQFKGKGEVVREEDVVVTHVESPLRFYVHVVDETQVRQLQYITESLPQFCSNAPSISGRSMEKHKIYAARFSDDGEWYRCKLSKQLEQNMVKIQYIDFGNGEEKTLDEIVELPSSLATIPGLAHKYVLYGLKPSHTEGTLGFEQGVLFLQNLTGHKVFKAKVYTAVSEGIVPVILENDTVDVNQEVLNNAFGEKRFYSQQQQQQHSKKKDPKQLTLQQKIQKQMAATENTEPLLAQGVFDQGGIGTWVNQTPVPTPPRPQQVMGKNALFPQQHQQMDEEARPFTLKQGNNTSISQEGVTKRIQELTSGMEQVRQQLMKENVALKQQRDEALKRASKVEQERDRATIDLSTTKGKLKKLQEKHSAVSVQLAESNVSFKVKHLVTAINKIKHLRKQFPSDGQKIDIIENAIATALDPEKVTTTGLEIINKVHTSLEAYKKSQDVIKSYQEIDSVSPLLDDRNSLRKELHGDINKFLEAMKVLPLDKRCKKLRETVLEIEATFSVFLNKVLSNPVAVTEVSSLYSAWKTNKLGVFQDTRTKTNTRHNEVESCLRHIQQQFCFDSPGDESPTPKTDLDSLLNKFNSAINEELKLTDMSISQDKEFITLVTKSLVHELYQEQANIERLRTLQKEYTTLHDHLSPWLDSSPEVSDLQAVRKTIKSLKSKLRHKLADKQDLEETEDASNRDIAEVEKELEDIRKRLHSAFIREDEHLAELSDLNENHFPELRLLHPEMNLPNLMEYGCLLKNGRSLDQFNITPMENAKSLYKSYFCGNPVVLKEYLVDDEIGVNKKDFLTRAVTYNKIVHPNIVPIEAIFFVKGERQLFVQVPYYEKNLTTVSETCLKEEEVFMALYGATLGLQALHEAKLCHGFVHPNNVFLNKQGQGVLEEVELSKPLDQVVECNAHKTANGLKFIAPEIKKDKNITPAMDVYSLGLLALWMSFPGMTFTMKKRVPDLTGLEMSKRLAELLEKLLNPDPSRRPSIDEVLHLSYFTSNHTASSAHRHREITLQLRPKLIENQGSSPVLNKSPQAGILKNGSSSPQETFSPTPAIPQQDETNTKESKPVLVENLTSLLMLDSAGSAELNSSDTSLLVQVQEEDLEIKEDEELRDNSMQSNESTPVATSPGLLTVNDMRPSSNELTPPTLDTPANTPSEPADSPISVSASIEKNLLHQAALLAALKEEKLEEEEEQANGEEEVKVEEEHVAKDVEVSPETESDTQLESSAKVSTTSSDSKLDDDIVKNLKTLLPPNLPEAALTQILAAINQDSSSDQVNIEECEDSDGPPDLEEV